MATTIRNITRFYGNTTCDVANFTSVEEPVIVCKVSHRRNTVTTDFFMNQKSAEVRGSMGRVAVRNAPFE